MKYIFAILLSVLFLSLSFSFSNAQILESEYVREGQEQGEVLGVETVDLSLNYDPVEIEENPEFELMDILAVLGGLAIIAVVAYSVYSNREDN